MISSLKKLREKHEVVLDEGDTMSRSYDEFCPQCQRENARINDDRDAPWIVQCLDCGTTFLKEERTVITWLKANGTDEKTWKKAKKEGYSISKQENNGTTEVQD